MTKEKDRQLLIEFQNYLWNTKGGMMPMHPKNIEIIADIFLSQRESREEKDGGVRISESIAKQLGENPFNQNNP